MSASTIKINCQLILSHKSLARAKGGRGTRAATNKTTPQILGISDLIDGLGNPHGQPIKVELQPCIKGKDVALSKVAG